MIPATWRYLFNGTIGLAGNLFSTGPIHGSEIMSVWGSQQSGWNAQQLALSRTMNKAWADFAKDPQKGPGWAQIGKDAKDVGDFGTYGDGTIMQARSSAELDKNCALYDSRIGQVAYPKPAEGVQFRRLLKVPGKDGVERVVAFA